MKNKIIDSIGNIDNDMVENVDFLRQKKSRKPLWVKWASIAACLCLVLAGVVTMVPKHYETLMGDSIQEHVDNNQSDSDTVINDYAPAEINEAEFEATEDVPLGATDLSIEDESDSEPAESFSCTEDAVKKIHEIKDAGSEAMAHPDDYKLYEKDYIYFLKDEQPLSDYKQESVMVTLGGTAMLYLDDKYNVALFTWTQDGEKEEMVEERINRYSLEQYKDTKYYFGELFGDVDIHWWENGDEFCFSYPADTGVSPEELIDYLEVVRYDF